MNSADIARKVAEEIIENKSTVNQPRVFVLVGLQYSGKSFLAEKLEEKNFAHFWATKIKKEYGIKNTEMLGIARKVLQDVVHKKYNLVIDFVNHKTEDRKKFQLLSESLKAEYSVIFLDIPKAERLKRRNANLSQGNMPGRRLISLEQMEEFEKNFETPKADENAVHLMNDADIVRFINTL